MTTIANLTFIDPRPTWDARAGELEQAEARLSLYVAIAKKLGDVAAIDAAETRLADLRSARDVYSGQRGAVDEAFDRLDSARAQLEEASVAWSAGADDAATALKLHAAKVVAEAAVAFTRAPLPGLCASAGASRERASRAMVGPENTVVQEHEELVRTLLEGRSAGPAFALATALGKRSNADSVTFWPIAESLARESLRKALNVPKRELQTFEIDHRRLDPFKPTEEHLTEAFAQKRRAFEAERARVAAQLAALTGQASAMGGAS